MGIPRNLVAGSESSRMSWVSDPDYEEPEGRQQNGGHNRQDKSQDDRQDKSQDKNQDKNRDRSQYNGQDKNKDKSQDDTLTRPKRGVTPNRPLLARTKSRENTAKKIASGSIPDSWTSVEGGRCEAGDRSGNAGQQLSRLIFTWIQKLNPLKQSQGIKDILKDAASARRVVSKKGKINTHRTQERDCSVILKDLFISSIQLSWTWVLFNFFASFVCSWAFFAVIWYNIALIHGDLTNESSRPPGHRVCVENVEDFTTAFLFSLETQHTIGYGGRATTSQCPVAIMVMSFQSIIGVFINSCMTGIVFAKFTKPTHRAKTILFSKNALVTMRNGGFYLLCRVGDLRPTHLIESHISGYVMRKQTTEEGEEIPYHLHAIEFGTDLDGTQDFFQLFWPIVLSHRIDENSPLWEVAPKDMMSEKFEIVLTMEGTTPETGNNIQVRTSYLPSEILWGYKFQHSCVDFKEGSGKYEVTFDTLNTIIKDNTPRMSPQMYEASQLGVADTSSLCSHCSDRPMSAIPKAFFGKARTKNKTHKLPGEKEDK